MIINLKLQYKIKQAVPNRKCEVCKLHLMVAIRQANIFNTTQQEISDLAVSVLLKYIKLCYSNAHSFDH